jgi:uncharacterized protein YbjT (DUF2867 family)
MPRTMNAVTGAFGYTGKYIARRLLELNEPVITLTGHPGSPNEFGSAVRAFPFRFDDPEAMAEFLAGVQVLYNTYWIRFDRGSATHEHAIANTRALIRAAEIAGVPRVVHISITNPDPHSPLPYFRGKAQVESTLQASGLSYAIVRPTLVFGPDDLLVNNIAWILRRFPVFVVPGDGRYEVQPVSVRDAAQICVDAGAADENVTRDAAGPDRLVFDELVRLIARAVGSRSRIVHASPRAALRLTRVGGLFVRDVVLTREEVEGLTAGLLVSDEPPLGRERFDEWLTANAGDLGRRWASELARNFRGQAPSMAP